jgi:flagellar basal-body rod protein FlgB
MPDMDLGSIPLFKAIERRMSWLNERQSVLAENVANADTPDFTPHDLKPLGFKALVDGSGGKLAMTVTDADQISGIPADGTFSKVADPAPEKTLSGNSVDLEGEMIKVSDTANDYQLVTEIYRQQISMLKTAIGGNSG